LRDGSWVEHVYFAEAESWYLNWGAWPDEDAGKRWVDLTEVVAVDRSPDRLPPEFERVIDEAGESGMGYSLFSVQFADGTSAAYCTGNAVDFIPYPDGQSEATVAGVLPHAGRNDPDLRYGLDYAWCLFSREGAWI
jgi:hypothetical protein